MLSKIAIALGTLVTISSASPSPKRLPFNWHTTQSLLAFGDSYTYVQGTAGLQNYSFIGTALDYSYTPQTLLTNKIVQNQVGTSAGGPNWVEYLTGCFEGLPSRCNRFAKGQKELWDFAFAGSDISAKYLPLHHNYSVDLDSQVREWAEFAAPYLPINKKETLVAVWIGINDVSDSAKNTTIASFPAFYTTLIDTLFDSLQIVYNRGFRNFLFMNLPPLDRTPGNVVNALAGKTVTPNATQVDSYNAILASHAQAFQKANRGAKSIVFDVNTFLNGVIENGATYGLKNVTGYCPRFDAPDIATNYAAYGCIPIDEYFWYNTGHVTYKVHQILASEVAQFLLKQ
ncbi:hypothetical protein MMC25_005032 [Agyrium rufum]|nr:hypothetical protein [Agyrium rufum]